MVHLMESSSWLRSRVGRSTIAIVLLLGGCGGGGDAGDDTVATTVETADSTIDSTPSTSDVDAAGETAGAVDLALATDGGRTGGPLEVRVELTNNTDDSVTVVRPFLAPNFVSFHVEDGEGTSMPFYGPHPQLRPLGDEHFVVLAPDESVIEIIDLESGYQLDPGTYTVSAEYLNPAAGSHEGNRAAIFEPGDGPLAEPIELEVSS